MNEAEKLREQFAQLWNDDRIDEVGEAFYAEDALIMPPGQEPIRGRDRIVEFMKELHKTVGGEGEFGVIEAVADRELAYVAGTFDVPHIGVRVTTLETYRRQPDGSWRCVVDAWHSSQPE